MILQSTNTYVQTYNKKCVLERHSQPSKAGIQLSNKQQGEVADCVGQPPEERADDS